VRASLFAMCPAYYDAADFRFAISAAIFRLPLPRHAGVTHTLSKPFLVATWVKQEYSAELAEQAGLSRCYKTKDKHRPDGRHASGSLRGAA